jgi:predicted double-glycine peptidase
MKKIILTVLLKDNQIKSILGPKTSFPNTKWWDTEITVVVPLSDWESEKITVSTIRHYILTSK